MRLKELIEKTKLSEFSERTIQFEGLDIKYIAAKKKHVFPSGKLYTYAEYYLIHINDFLISKISKFDKFREFQTKLMAPIFFKHMNDLRWNLYVLFLSDDECEFQTISVSQIESDDNYGRKYFFTYDETISFLNREDLFIINENEASKEFKSGHFQEWVKILCESKLTGCLSDTQLREKNVENYLDTGSFEDISFLDGSIISERVGHTNKSRIDRVAALKVGEFRGHCFDNLSDIGFGQVNLLQGSNGCGKTSITEAIELAITNDIKRLKDLKEIPGNYQGLKVTLESPEGIAEYSPGLSPAEYKQIDNYWYGVQVGMGSSTLNKSFNRFNYLDADATYRFTKEQSLNTDEKYDYANGLKNLFFDDETLEMEKKWLWYYKKFNDSHKRLIREIEVLRVQKDETVNKIKEMVRNSKSNVDEIVSLTKEVKYIKQKAFKILDNHQAMRELNGTLKAIENTVNRLIDSSKVQNLNCYNAIMTKEIELYKLVENIKNSMIETANEKENIVIRLNKLNKKEEKYINRKTMLEKKNTQFERDSAVWNEIKHIFINRDKLDDLKSQISIKEQIIKQLSLISTIKVKFPGIEEINENEILSRQEISLEALESEISSLEINKEELVESISKLKAKVGKIENIKARLKALGEEYLQINGNNGECPLCGYPYGDKTSLSNKISNLSLNSNEANKMKFLEKDKNDIDSLIGQKKTLYQKEKIYHKKIELINGAFNELKVSQCFDIDVENKVIFILKKIHEIFGMEDSLKEKYKKSLDLIALLEEEGFTDNNIAIAKNFAEHNTLFREYVAQGKDIKLYSETITLNKKRISSMVTKLDIFITDIVLKKNELNSKISLLKTDEKLMEKELGNYNKVLQEIHIIKNCFSLLREYFSIGNDEDIYMWAEKYSLIKALCESEIYYIENGFLIKKLRNDLTKLELELTQTISRKKRCDIAINAFEKMPKLNDSITDFFENNKERIIYFFRLIHMPKEFEDKLEYDEKGFFKLNRKGTGEEVRCPQMSTGQRVSLALSVFFSLHISARNAPRFIMLDEPVANLDDLHLLNLLDILRDFAINNIQIFLTTANQEVAGLFRRKFSFFEGEFRHFKFERTNSLPVKIKQITYNPMEDIGHETLLKASSHE